MSDCSQFDTTLISRATLHEFWLHGILEAALLFRKYSEVRGKFPKSTSDSKQGTNLELHTWFPYENSQRCDPAEGTVAAKVFPIRNPCDVRSDIFEGHFIKDLNGCPIRVHVHISPPFLNALKRFGITTISITIRRRMDWKLN
jgi:hypothetical protein